MRQRAAGHVQLVEHHERSVVEKRIRDASRCDTEVLALRSLANRDLPVPELVGVGPESIRMTLMPGERLGSTSADV